MFRPSMFSPTMFSPILIAALLAAPLCASGADDKAKTPQQQKQQAKMKACNKEARDKSVKGDDRKKFVAECLKGPAKG